MSPVTFENVLQSIIRATNCGDAVWNSGGEIYTFDTGKNVFSLWPDNTIRVQNKYNEVVIKVSQDEPDGRLIPELRQVIEANRNKVLSQIIGYFQ